MVDGRRHVHSADFLARGEDYVLGEFKTVHGRCFRAEGLLFFPQQPQYLAFVVCARVVKQHLH